MQKIDQQARQRLCQEMLKGNIGEAKAAQAALAELYRAAGLATLARAVEAGLAGALRHASGILGEAVSVRQAQAAAMALGDAATSAIVGPGGLSGATAKQLRRLVQAANEGGQES